MKFSHFFIDRPIFATVLSILLLIVGGLAYVALPVAQYPEIAPPTIEVSATYPGANAETVANTVATPLEQEINGVEGMLYMFSQSTGDGRITLTITFKLGTDLDEAQVLVQNRVAIAEPRLPEEVRRLGVTTRKNSPNLMMVVNLYSPDRTYDQIYIANYATLQLRDALARIDGAGDIQIFGASEYAMRIWLDPDRIAALGLTAGDVVTALRAQNVQVASGILNQSPMPQQNAFELSVQTQGRLVEPHEFENIVVKSADNGRVVRLKDVGRAELGAQSYVTRGYLGGKPAIALLIYQRPGSNVLETADEVVALMEGQAQEFPEGLAYEIVYNPTAFVRESVNEVTRTIFEAVILVTLVIIIFLQSWRAALIPVLAIPVSLVATFAVMQAMGFSLNSLSLFGLVLAIGIVVDDAIIVVENMERLLATGMRPRNAARQTMDEVGGALVAMGLVLVAVFLPTTFLAGISGQFYRQFGITIAVATMVSVLVSLTLSPAMATLLLQANSHGSEPQPAVWWKHPVAFLFSRFNIGLNRVSDHYSWLISKLVRMGLLTLIVYAGLMVMTTWQFQRVPTGFIPPQDKGYFIVGIQLPPGASLTRTDAVVQKATKRLLGIDGVVNAVGFAGFSGATFTNASNAAAIFPVLDEFHNRTAKGLTYDGILAKMRQSMAELDEAFIVVIPPPPVEGIGSSGGFRMMIQDRRGRGLEALKDAAYAMMGTASQAPEVTSVFTLFETSTPQLYLDINRQRAERLGVPVRRVFEALEVYLGSVFVNDFNYLGRTFRVTAQADSPYRFTADDIVRLRVRNHAGEMAPIGSVATFNDTSGPSRVPRYNLFPAAALIGDVAPGYSSGEALNTMERLAEATLPSGFSYEWTELALQQKQTGNTAAIAFVLAVVFVFLLLAAQYESWTLPLAVILIVPMCLLSAIMGIAWMGMDNNVLTQIGFVVLVGLATKNAILIVEFAKQQEDEGKSRWEAAVDASRLRLRPILMTAFSFILGVVPLVIATGAGAEMRRALGTAVFSGMLGVTVFGLLFTPVFYVLCRGLAGIGRRRLEPLEPAAQTGAQS